MTYKETIETVKNIVDQNESVKSFYYGSIYNMSKRRDWEYPVVVLSPRITSTQGDFYRYGFTLWYVDIQVKERTDTADIQSQAIQTLTDITLSIDESSEIEGVSFAPINVFSERFADICAGAMCDFEVLSQMPACSPYPPIVEYILTYYTELGEPKYIRKSYESGSIVELETLEQLGITIPDDYIFEGWMINGVIVEQVVMDTDKTVEAVLQYAFQSYWVDINGTKHGFTPVDTPIGNFVGTTNPVQSMQIGGESIQKADITGLFLGSDYSTRVQFPANIMSYGIRLRWVDFSEVVYTATSLTNFCYACYTLESMKTPPDLSSVTAGGGNFLANDYLLTELSPITSTGLLAGAAFLSSCYSLPELDISGAIPPAVMGVNSCHQLLSLKTIKIGSQNYSNTTAQPNNFSGTPAGGQIIADTYALGKIFRDKFPNLSTWSIVAPDTPPEDTARVLKAQAVQQKSLSSMQAVPTNIEKIEHLAILAHDAIIGITEITEEEKEEIIEKLN